jgi:non-ribosomal peptide synthetase component F
MIIGILAVLKLGASYIPLDGGIVPSTTLDSILNDAGPRAILCSARYSSRVSEKGHPVYVLDKEVDAIHRSGVEEFGEIQSSEALNATDEAYIVYTSGRSHPLLTFGM